jgi:hypothetical protein
MASRAKSSAANRRPYHLGASGTDAPIHPLKGIPMKSFLALACSLLVTTSAIAQEAILEEGRERTEAFFAGNLQDIWDDMTPDLQQALGDFAAFEAFQQSVEADLGTEEEMLEEQATEEAGFRVYLTGSNTPVDMQWAFDEADGIGGFFIQPQTEPAPTQYLDYETNADLRLPFDGEWYVFWGGRSTQDNYHASNPAQRFAYDFVVHEDGVSHAGEADVLENYHCWGREILAPADALVVATVNDLPDQAIGQTDLDNPAGNHVILAFGEDEYAFLAHLQQGSVRVQQGQEIEQGDILGLCGNSGNTSEPHLHFHMQTTADLLAGDGLPALFNDLVADGEPMERGEPVRGQYVEHAD